MPRNGVSPVLSKLRGEALASFEALGFPKPRTEAWKYTNIRSVLRKEISLVPTGTAPPTSLGLKGMNSTVLVCINGRFSPAHSRIGPLPDGIVVGGLQASFHSHSEQIEYHLGRYARSASCPFVALNTAACTDGAFVYLPKGTCLERPVQIVHSVTSGAFFQPRSLVIAEADTSVDLILLTLAPSGDASFANSVAEVSAGPNSRVNAYTIQPAADNLTAVTSLNAYQAAGSQFGSHTATIGGQTVRNNLTITPAAPNCHTTLNGLFLGGGSTHIDNHTLVDHAKPDCESSELYKGILDGRATGVFNGKVMVRQDAQRINAYQTSKAIVLSRDAKMFAKPELEIYADDVKCSHGATTGQLEKEALFYLQSRGLTEKQARDLLLEAFARDFMVELPNSEVRLHLEQAVAHWLGSR